MAIINFMVRPLAGGGGMAVAAGGGGIGLGTGWRQRGQDGSVAFSVAAAAWRRWCLAAVLSSPLVISSNTYGSFP